MMAGYEDYVYQTDEELDKKRKAAIEYAKKRKEEVQLASSNPEDNEAPGIVTQDKLSSEKIPVGEVTRADETDTHDLSQGMLALSGGLASMAGAFGGFKPDLTPTSLAMDYVKQRQLSRENRRKELLQEAELTAQKRRQNRMDLLAYKKEDREAKEFRQRMDMSREELAVRERIAEADRLAREKEYKDKGWEKVEKNTPEGPRLVWSNPITGETRDIGAAVPKPISGSSSDSPLSEVSMSGTVERGVSLGMEKPERLTRGEALRYAQEVNKRDAVVQDIIKNDARQDIAKAQAMVSLDQADEALNAAATRGYKGALYDAKMALIKAVTNGRPAVSELQNMVSKQDYLTELSRFVDEKLMGEVNQTDIDMMKNLLEATRRSVDAKYKNIKNVTKSQFMQRFPPGVGEKIFESRMRAGVTDTDTPLQSVMEPQKPAETKKPKSYIVGKEYKYGNKKLRYTGKNLENPQAGENWEVVP